MFLLSLLLHVMRSFACLPTLSFCSSPKNLPVCLTIVAFDRNSANCTVCELRVRFLMVVVLMLLLSSYACSTAYSYCRHLVQSILLLYHFSGYYFKDKSQFGLITIECACAYICVCVSASVCTFRLMSLHIPIIYNCMCQA